MRTFGLLLLIAGIAGGVYFSNELGGVDPLPTGLSISESLREPAGKLEAARDASVAAGIFGLIFIALWKGR
jgi:hypothetical protein